MEMRGLGGTFNSGHDLFSSFTLQGVKLLISGDMYFFPLWDVCFSFFLFKKTRTKTTLFLTFNFSVYITFCSLTFIELLSVCVSPSLLRRPPFLSAPASWRSPTHADISRSPKARIRGWCERGLLVLRTGVRTQALKYRWVGPASLGSGSCPFKTKLSKTRSLGAFVIRSIHSIYSPVLYPEITLPLTVRLC